MFCLISTETAEGSDRILEGYLYKMGGPFLSGWQKRYFLLYPNRIEWKGEQVCCSFHFLPILSYCSTSSP